MTVRVTREAQNASTSGCYHEPQGYVQRYCIPTRTEIPHLVGQGKCTPSLGALVAEGCIGGVEFS